MLEQKQLNQTVKGERIDHYLLLRKCELKTSKNGKQYLNLELGDQWSTLPSNYWEGYEEFYAESPVGSVVKVTGIVEDYQGQSQIRLTSIRTANTDDGVTPYDFQPRSRRDLAEMKKEFGDRIDLISNPYLKKLLALLLAGQNLELFSRAPAGKSWHHSYISGLLEHTLEIIRICDLMCDIHPEAKRDLLIAGAIMHDFGKIEELTFDGIFDYSEKGKLLGHIVISAMKISEKADKIPGFPEDLKVQLIHLVLSHQGKLEFASPVVPKMLESIILYQADELSAKTNAYKSAILAESGNPSGWTRYQQLAGTPFYIPEELRNHKNETNK